MDGMVAGEASLGAPHEGVLKAQETYGNNEAGLHLVEASTPSIPSIVIAELATRACVVAELSAESGKPDAPSTDEISALRARKEAAQRKLGNDERRTAVLSAYITLGLI